jgi:hypothetical protein
VRHRMHEALVYGLNYVPSYIKKYLERNKKLYIYIYIYIYIYKLSIYENYLILLLNSAHIKIEIY